MSNANKTTFGPDPAPPAVRPYAASERPPAGAIKVDNYKDYKELIGKWISGKLDDTLVVLGSAGIGKSEQAMAGLRKQPHCYLKGQATRFGVYLQLFEHINQPVVLDDVDTLLASREVTGLLKMLLETRSPRTMQWTTGQTMLDQNGIPAAFATTSRTMILANELKLVSKNFGAVLDRATIIWFAPPPEEIHEYVKTWFKNEDEVLNFVGERLHATPHPSCRYYYHGKKWKQAGLDWKKMLNEQMFPADSKAMLVKTLDTKHKNAKDRVNEWVRLTGESAQAYWATKKSVDLKAGKTSKRGASISEGMKRKWAERKAGTAQTL